MVNQFHLYRSKGMSVTESLHIFRNQGQKCVKENWPLTKCSKIVKSHKINVFIMHSCKIISSNGNRLTLSRPNDTQILVLCQFNLQFHAIIEGLIASVA